MPYSAHHKGESFTRAFFEKDDPTRSPFQRDRDRIIHSKAFRRLRGKTQVFVATYGDHFRDRLTHSLEVAQVARDLARSLHADEDLSEAIALAHDLGHPPFGHAGESTLNTIMKTFGGHFEHNEQSKRIVEKLEKQFPQFDGLNLTYAVRQGLAKHQTAYDQAGRKISGKTLEAQIVDLADEIAYHNHDLDDGLRSHLFDFKKLARVELWKEASERVRKKYGRIENDMVLRHRTVSQLISLMIANVLEHTSQALKKSRMRSVEDIVRAKKSFVQFSSAFKKKVDQLRQFLWDEMYQSPKVMKHSRRGQKVLEELFWILYKHPELMPGHFCEKIDVQEPREVVIKDYVAGCTDVYATEKLNALVK